MDDAYYQKIIDALDNMGLDFLRIDATHRDIIVYKSKYGDVEFVTHISIIFLNNRITESLYKN
jgi:hypothetical protein